MSAAYDAFVDWYGQDVGGPTSYTFKEAFEAGYRRALEDAANELDADQLIAHWGGSAAIRLRARAAAVAPRETKD